MIVLQPNLTLHQQLQTVDPYEDANGKNRKNFLERRIKIIKN